MGGSMPEARFTLRGIDFRLLLRHQLFLGSRNSGRELESTPPIVTDRKPTIEPGMTMPRDIDYAATAVKTAIVNKFGRTNDLAALDVIAGEQTITVRHGEQTTEGTRDSLMAGIRDANSYEGLWKKWWSA